MVEHVDPRPMHEQAASDLGRARDPHRTGQALDEEGVIVG
jgi:hypothetical protein